MDRDSIDIVVCGHLCLDLYPDISRIPLAGLSQPGKLFEIGALGVSTGGAVSNTGLSLYKLGAKVGLMSAVGDDFIGQLMLDFIKAYHPNLTDFISVLPNQASSYTIVLSPHEADRSFLHFAGTNAIFNSSHINEALLDGVKIFHLGYPTVLPALCQNDGEELALIFRKVKQRGIVTSLDLTLPDPNGAVGQVNWKRLFQRVLPFVDIFIPSIEEILFMLRRADFHKWGTNWVAHLDRHYLHDLAGELLSMGVSIAGFKLGDRGFYIRTASEWDFDETLTPISKSAWENVEFWHPAFEVVVEGTTGAGDSAYAAFLNSLLFGFDPLTAVQAACAVGAANVEARDALNGVCAWAEIETRIQQGWKTLNLKVSGF